ESDRPLRARPRARRARSRTPVHHGRQRQRHRGGLVRADDRPHGHAPARRGTSRLHRRGRDRRAWKSQHDRDRRTDASDRAAPRLGRRRGHSEPGGTADRDHAARSPASPREGRLRDVARVWLRSGMARARRPATWRRELRLHLGYFLVEVLTHPRDPRFAGKAIPVRNLLIVGGLSLLFPALHFVRRRWRRYPFWTDALWLSLFWLDMAGHSLDLYDRYSHFDLLPHFHGTGAAAIAVRRGFVLSRRRAFWLTDALHALLEAQELATDVLFGTHNVRGWWDTAGGPIPGLLGSGGYP